MKICGKKSFSSKEEAERIIRNIRKKGLRKRCDKGKRPIRSYYCKKCEHWHQTSAKKHQKKKRLSRKKSELVNTKKFIQSSKSKRKEIKYLQNFAYIEAEYYINKNNWVQS